MEHESGRTAPKSWETWPPEQTMVNGVVERACRALATQIEGQLWITGVILVAMPAAAPHLDASFSGSEAEIESRD